MFRVRCKDGHFTVAGMCLPGHDRILTHIVFSADGAKPHFQAKWRVEDNNMPTLPTPISPASPSWSRNGPAPRSSRRRTERRYALALNAMMRGA